MSSRTADTEKDFSKADSKSFWDDMYTSWAQKAKSEDESHMFSRKPAHILLSESAVFDHLLADLGKQRNRSEIKVLELGAGQGRNGIYLVKRYGFSVKAIDVSAVACADALRNSNAMLGSEAELYDVQEMDMIREDLGTEKYDAIVALFVQITPNHAELHERLVKALKPGGYLILQGFTHKQLKNIEGNGKKKGPPAENLYDADDLRREFSSLTIKRAEDRDLDLTGYGAFDGVSAVVDFVGYKPK